MTILDLDRMQDRLVTRSADVCVIGAGIAGVTLARRLAQAGRKVIVVESGPRIPVHPAANRIQDLNGFFKRAEDGRARGLGGTSAIWGGRLLPLTPGDVGERPYLELPAWPIAHEELVRYNADIERLFGLDDLSYEESFLREIGAQGWGSNDKDFVARWPKWPEFRKCNLAYCLRQELNAPDGPDYWLNATVQGFALNSASGRIASLDALGGGGKRLNVSAPEFVLAAGTIESTRLLLWLNEQSGRRAFEGCEALGRYFQDHISCDLGIVDARDRAEVSRIFGFHFVGSTRRNLHLELTPYAQRLDRVGSAFVQVSLEPSEKSTLEVIKNFLRNAQRGRFALSGRDLSVSLKGMPEMMKLAAWRYGRKQLYLPADVRLVLSGVLEQMPRAENVLSLGAEIDAGGLPQVRMDWRIGEQEVRAYRALIRRTDVFWRRAGFQKFAPINWTYDAIDPDSRIIAGARDTAHPSGSARMGTGRKDSVVNAQLQCHAVPNLSVASAATFPSSGSANPTYTIMQLAMKCADEIARRLTTGATLAA